MTNQPTTEVPTDVLKRICAVAVTAHGCEIHEKWCQIYNGQWPNIEAECNCDFGAMANEIKNTDADFMMTVLRDEK